MEERFYGYSREEEFGLGDCLGALRKSWWKVLLLTLAGGLATLAWMLQEPDIFQAKAVITPAVDPGRNVSPMTGALAMFGIDLGGPSSTGDLETLFNSEELTVRVFRKYDLWPILLADRIDPATGQERVPWTDRLFGRKRAPGPRTDWDAIRAARGMLRVAVNKKGGTVSITANTPSREGSARVLRAYLDEAKNRLQEEALDRAIKNNKFISEQISKTVDALTRERLYALYGQEVEREMMARNREQFGFRVIDPPRAPDKKFRPSRGKNAVIGAGMSFFLGWALFVIVVERKKGKESRGVGDEDGKSAG